MVRVNGADDADGANSVAAAFAQTRLATAHDRFLALPPATTTLIVQHLHGRVTAEELVSVWPPVEYGYNLLYIPFNHRCRRPACYGFINFVSTAAAESFGRRWHDKIMPGSHAKCLAVSVAEVQGWRTNVLHIKADGIEQIVSQRFLPVVFDEHFVKLDVRAVIAKMLE